MTVNLGIGSAAPASPRLTVASSNEAPAKAASPPAMTTRHDARGAEAPRASWRVVIAGGLAAFAGASLLLATVRRGDAGAAEPMPRLTVIGSRAPIRLIALDGFDVPTYERLK